MNETKYTYVQNIGMLTTRQFGKMQKLLEPLNELERMEILFNQLKLEIEAVVEMIESDDELDGGKFIQRKHKTY